MLHGLAASALGFGCARFFLGLGEAGNFPAAIKTVAEWFPKRERALATGVFNSGSNAGAILAPLLVPWLTLRVRLAMGVRHGGRRRVGLDRGVAAHLPRTRAPSGVEPAPNSTTSAASPPNPPSTSRGAY